MKKETKKTLTGLIAVLLIVFTLSTAIPVQSYAAQEETAKDGLFDLGWPYRVTAETTTTTATVKWSNVLNASGYAILNKVNDKWRTVVVLSTGNTYTFSGLTPGKTYTLAIKAFKIEDGKTVWAEKQNEFTVTTKQAGLGITSELTYTSTDSSIKLNWKAVDGATGYRVYRMTENGWKILVNTKNTTYTENGLKTNQKYTYAVKAYKQVGDKLVMAKQYKIVEAATAFALTKPANLKYTSNDTSVTLTWDVVDGATGYRVFKKEGKSWVQVGRVTTKNTFTISDLEPKKNYTFAVRAFRIKSFKVEWANSYSYINTTTKRQTLGTPSGLSYCATNTSVTLNWSAVGGATGYRVFIMTNKGWSAVGNTKQLTYTIKGLGANKTYQLAIRAYKIVDGKTEWADKYATISVQTTVTTLK